MHTSLCVFSGERPYNCGACGQRYTQGHLLKSHIRSRHAGNMEYYNLEKKSDSTRGRKSLDAKHDLSGATPLQKQEKINSLVAQLEQQKINQMMSSPMSQFMSSMSYINSLRPLMAAPLALTGSMMAGPPMFTVRAIQNGIGNGTIGSNMLPVSQGLSLMGSHVPQAINHTVPQLDMAGIKLPVKTPEIINGPYQSHPSPPHLQPIHIKPIAPTAQLTELPDDYNAPQDLSTKKSPPREIIQNEDNHRDLCLPKSPCDTRVYQPQRVINYVEPKMRHVRVNGKSLKRPCEDDGCTHAKKLHDLRRNIVRMLSVLTPDLSIENGLNYNSDQVDELLHEVIYSNMDDMDEYSRKT